MWSLAAEKLIVKIISNPEITILCFEIWILSYGNSD